MVHLKVLCICFWIQLPHAFLPLAFPLTFLLDSQKRGLDTYKAKHLKVLYFLYIFLCSLLFFFNLLQGFDFSWELFSGFEDLLSLSI